MKITYLHWTKSRGAGGRLLSPGDFAVREIIDKKFLRKFSRSSSGVSIQTGYFLYLMKKENITTKDAIKKIARMSGIAEKEIGYAGMKDKFAKTEQYVTIKRDIGDINTGPVSLKKIKTTSGMISVGDLTGNSFTITLHGVKSAGIMKEIASRTMPNYFGPQRFGIYKNNHIAGRCIVRRDFGKALEIISKNTKSGFMDIRKVDKRGLKFCIHAYQSWIFNEALNRIIRDKRKAGTIKIVGCDTKLGNTYADRVVAGILEKERVRPPDFSIKKLRLSCRGALRKAFINVGDINYERNGGRLTLEFSLPKGSYATVLINEITKV